jgi:hypothetical protein
MARGPKVQIMKLALTVVATVVTFGLMAPATPARAQVVVVGPAGISQTALVCELRREQINDERGWRVRDVFVCFPR